MPRPKLPRKRKKAYIKANGRQRYKGNIALAIAENECPCKFWKEVKTKIEYFNGVPIPIPTPISYW